MAGIVSAVIGGILALIASFGLVNSVAGSTPEPVDAPYIVYGQS